MNRLEQALLSPSSDLTKVFGDQQRAVLDLLRSESAREAVAQRMHQRNEEWSYKGLRRCRVGRPRQVAGR